MLRPARGDRDKLGEVDGLVMMVVCCVFVWWFGV